MNGNYLKSNNGFSIIEIIFSLAILLMLFGVCFSLFIRHVRFFNYCDSTYTVIKTIHTFEKSISNDCKNALSFSIDNDILTITVPSASIVYRLKNSRLVRIKNTGYTYLHTNSILWDSLSWQVSSHYIEAVLRRGDAYFYVSEVLL
ncbi:hypothetical protein ACFL56_01640 [Candidatus Margulisiibacteriota bacterium]